MLQEGAARFRSWGQPRGGVFPCEALRADLNWKAKLVIAVLVLWVPVTAGWQIGSGEIANLELHADLRDIASQLGPRVGLYSFSKDEDIRKAVIHAAARYDIQLKPEQITVKHSSDNKISDLYLAVDYKTPIKIPGYTFALHFTASTEK